MRPRATAPVVYFLRPVGSSAGPIKIGCSRTPAARLSGMMVWSPVPLELVCAAPGDRVSEGWLHYQFRHLRSHSEWFFGGPDLVAYVQSVTDTQQARGAPLGESVYWGHRLDALGSILKQHGIARAAVAAQLGVHQGSLANLGYHGIGRLIGALADLGAACSAERLAGLDERRAA